MTSQFNKVIHGTDPAEFDVILKHSRDVIESLKYSEFKTPTLLGSSTDIIYYEFFELPVRLDEEWKHDSLNDESFIAIGRMLSRIHRSLDINLLHGDFVLHNIFFNLSQEICVIDCHPPEVIGYNYHYLYGNQNLEMYLFLINLSSSYGLKSSIASPHRVRQAIKNFRSGYGWVSDKNALLLAMLRNYRIRRSGGFSILNALAHLTIGLYFIVSSYE